MARVPTITSRDRRRLLAATIVAALIWAVGWSKSAADEHARRASDGRLPPRWTGSTLAVGSALPFNLPPGVEVDPVTGRLVGLDADGTIPWSTFEDYTYQDGLTGLPEKIRALDGKTITMIGFLQPEYDYTDIAKFTLVASHWSCCYGVPAGLSGSVLVQLRDDAERMSLTVLPLRVEGRFRIEEMKDSGIVFSIYALDEATATVLHW